MVNNWKHEVDGVFFSNPGAQLRYLQRLEHRYFTTMMAAKRGTFANAEAAYEYVQAAIKNFSVDAHMERLRARNWEEC